MRTTDFTDHPTFWAWFEKHLMHHPRLNPNGAGLGDLIWHWEASRIIERLGMAESMRMYASIFWLIVDDNTDVGQE